MGQGHSAHSNNDCDCPTVERSLITHPHREFCVHAEGSYEIEPDDKVVFIHGEDGDVTLPCPDDVNDECHSVTVIAADADVNVQGLGTNNGGNGTATVLARTAVTFWLVEPQDKCACGFWVAECCGGPLAPGTTT